MKAHWPDDHRRVPGAGRGRTLRPDGPSGGTGSADRLDGARLLRLNRLAGNAAVSSLVGSASGGEPVLQRIPLSSGDKQRIKSLKKTDKKLAAKAKERIEAFTGGQGGVWNLLSGFPVGSKVPEPERNEYLAALYRALGRDASLDDLIELREKLNQEYGETLSPAKTAKTSPRFPRRAAVPSSPRST